MGSASPGAPDIGSNDILGQVEREASSSRIRTTASPEAPRVTHHAGPLPSQHEDAPSLATEGPGGSETVAEAQPEINGEDVTGRDPIRTPFSQDLEIKQYRALFQRHVASVFRDQRPPSSSTPRDARAAQQNTESHGEDTGAQSEWSEEEQHAFFCSLARRSRLRPDLISADLGARKTPAQVAHYLSQLHEEAKHLTDAGTIPTRKRRIRYTPTAHEASEQWIAAEEMCAAQMQAEEQRPRDDPKAGLLSKKAPVPSRTSVMPVSWDEQVLNATLFLRRFPNADHEAMQADLKLAPIYPRKIAAPIFRISQFIAIISIKRSDKRKKAQGAAKEEFRQFAETHPVPSMDGKKAARRGAPAKKKRRLVGTSDEDSDAATSLDAARGSETVPYRIVLRALELGLLMLVTTNPSAQQHEHGHWEYSILDRSKISSISYKRRKFDSTTPTLPTRHLDDVLVVWSDSLIEVSSDTSYPTWLVMHVRSAIDKMAAVTEKALDRVLSSLHAQELSWLAIRGHHSSVPDAVDEISEPESATDLPPLGDVAGHPTSESQSESRRGRGNRSDWYRGYSLAGLSAKEKERAKARIRMRERKYGKGFPADSRPALDPVPGPARRLGLAGHGPSRRSSVLQPFEHMLSQLDGDERRTAENRLRARIRSWGLERTMQTELGKLEGDGRCGRRDSRGLSASHSPLCEISEDGQHDTHNRERQETSTSEPTEAALDPPANAQPDQDEVGADVEPLNPDEVPAEHWGSRAARFHAIGVTRRQASARIAELIGAPMDFFKMDIIAKLVAATAYAQCVRGGEDGSPAPSEGQEAKGLNLDAVNTMPRLVEQLRHFLERLISVTISQATERGAHANITKQDVLDVLGMWDQPADVRAWYARQREDDDSLRLSREEQRIAMANMEADPPVVWQSEVDLDDFLSPAAAADPALEGVPSSVGRATSHTERCVVISRATEPPTDNAALTQAGPSGIHTAGAHAYSPLDAVSDDEEEVFDSKQEIAEVLAIRSGWGTLDQPFQTKNRVACVTVRQRGFYWPEEMPSLPWLGQESRADDITDESDDGRGERQAGTDPNGGAISEEHLDSDREPEASDDAADSASESGPPGGDHSKRRPRRHLRHRPNYQSRHDQGHASMQDHSDEDLSSDSGADSDGLWESLERQDERRDAAVEAKEWEFWFGRPMADSNQIEEADAGEAAGASQSEQSEGREVDES